jgi:acyl-CoA dehydrogenase family member 9
MKSLFHGVLAPELLFPYPSIGVAEQDELHLLLGQIRRFAASDVDSAKIDREATLSPQLLTGLRELGLFGIGIPQSFGGKGMRFGAHARILQELGGVDSSIAVTLGTHQFIGLRGLQEFGSEALKARYLPKAATGEWIAAFALTELQAGSDAAAIRTHAVRDGLDYILSGEKVWVTNGAFADIFTVFARTSSTDAEQKPRLTAFVVDRNMGVRTPKADGKLGIRGSSTTNLILDAVRVPQENILLGPERGFKVAVEVLNDGRLGLAAGCIGAAQKLLKLAIVRCKERRAFGRTIGEFGLVKDKVAQMATAIFALESMTYLTAGLAEAGHDCAIESAICKVFASEALWSIADHASQIAGGAGFAEDTPFERLLRDARANFIYTGSNDILRSFIALSGLHGPGTEAASEGFSLLADVTRVLREPLKGFGLLSGFALRKAKSAIGRERTLPVHSLLRRESEVLVTFAQELASHCETVLRRHGRSISEMQFTQRRIADMAIDLYAIAAVLSRATRAIEVRSVEGARREIDLATSFVRDAEVRLRQHAVAFEMNEDELRKLIADKTMGDGGYPLDVI